MCIDFDGHHFGGSCFVYVKMIFVITGIVCIPTGTSTALRKNRSMRVPIYSIDSIAPRTSVRIRQSGRTRDPAGVTELISHTLLHTLDTWLVLCHVSLTWHVPHAMCHSHGMSHMPCVLPCVLMTHSFCPLSLMTHAPFHVSHGMCHQAMCHPTPNCLEKFEISIISEFNEIRLGN